MALGDDWDAPRMFDLFLHDYLVKKNMRRTAAIFKEEANVCDFDVAARMNAGVKPMSTPSKTTVHLGQSSENQPQLNQLQLKLQQLFVNDRKRKAILHLRIGEKILDSEEVEVTPSVEKKESFLSDDDDYANSTSTPFNGGKMLDSEEDEVTPLVEYESFLSDDDDASSTNTPLNDPKRRHTASAKNEHKVGFSFTFNDFFHFHLNKDKVLCCHFSSNGKLLASAGHEKKVCILNLENLDTVKTLEAHNLLITDVRFQPSSTIFATSSIDRTVKVWDAARPNRSILELHGHEQKVMSLDFHPTTTDILCSCDINDEIRIWNVNQLVSTRTFKGAMKQVRFEPCFGKILATASGNVINLFDVETGSHQFSLKGHVKDVISVSWDQTGKYIVSISEESARLWSISSGGKCIHELHANGNKFQSCTFHPKPSNLIVIGGYQLIELWSPFDSSRPLSVPAHEDLVSALAKSEENEMVASASHDWCVKLWK